MKKLIFMFPGIVAVLAILALTVVLTGCATAPKQASSIEEYCAAVQEEAMWYDLHKVSGTEMYDLIGYINVHMGKQYPEREVLAMVRVVKLVYAGFTPESIYKVCVAERTDESWFTRR